MVYAFFATAWSQNAVEDENGCIDNESVVGRQIESHDENENNSSDDNSDNGETI